MHIYVMLNWERELRDLPMQENYTGELEVYQIFFDWWNWTDVFASNMSFDGPYGI
jgi:hypothetical protein